MQPQTIAQKILARASGRDYVKPGEYIEAKVDVIDMHDITSSGSIRVARELGNKIAPGLRIIVTPDHSVPAKDIKSANLYRELRDFALEHKGKGADIRTFFLEGRANYGICHSMLPQERLVRPGEVAVGMDSHMCTHGAVGAFATGIGSTDGGAVLSEGKLWFRVPETMRIEVSGEMPSNVMAKDLFLKVVGDIGVAGAHYQAMEWGGSTIRDMSMDGRLVLTNMAIEAGAQTGIIEPDDVTRDFFRYAKFRESTFEFAERRIIEREGELALDEFPKGLKEEGCTGLLDCVDILDYYCNSLLGDRGAKYSRTLKIDASGLEPLVACPDLPSNVRPARELRHVKIKQAFLGGCTGGNREDYVAAAEVLKGQKTADHVRLIVIPSTSEIQDWIIREGLYAIYKKAGATFGPPSCAACLGGHLGVIGKGEVAIATTNRNFRGRMGDPESFIYLASPKTVAQSAVTGHITGVAA